MVQSLAARPDTVRSTWRYTLSTGSRVALASTRCLRCSSSHRAGRWVRWVLLLGVLVVVLLVGVGRHIVPSRVARHPGSRHAHRSLVLSSSCVYDRSLLYHVCSCYIKFLYLDLHLHRLVRCRLSSCSNINHHITAHQASNQHVRRASTPRWRSRSRARGRGRALYSYSVQAISYICGISL